MVGNEVPDPVSSLDREEASLAARVGDEAHNVLLLAPPMDPCAEDGCADFLTVDAPSEEDVLYVTFVQSPDDRLESWRSRVGNERPARIGFVDVDGSTRSAVDATAGGGPAVDVTIQTVSSPGNLTDLGIKVSEYVEAWEADGNQTVICFHSLTALLQYADLQRAFRFLHVLTGRVRTTNGFAHYHMDPSAHDPRTLNTLMTLFDGVVEWDGEDWSVRSR